MPGDRLFIVTEEQKEERKAVREQEIIQGAFGSGSTLRGYDTMGRNYNRTRNGF